MDNYIVNRIFRNNNKRKKMWKLLQTKRTLTVGMKIRKPF